jgi:hypothetical protein
MLQNQTSNPPPIPKQMLLRLPDDVATKLARAVPPRQRNAFLVNLVRQELDKEDAELVAACDAMNALEATHPEQLAQEWLDADLSGSVDAWDGDFERETFEREFAIAQAQLPASKPNAKPSP